jgi:hypothetical protein
MKRTILSAIGAGLIAALGVLLLLPSVPIQAQVAGQTIIDTFPFNTVEQFECGAPEPNRYSATRGWVGTAQTITTPANGVLADYRFQLAPRSFEGGPPQVLFSVYAWVGGPVGAALYTTSVDWPAGGGVVDITGINVSLTPGTQYGMTIDLQGYSGDSVFFNCNQDGYNPDNSDSGWWVQTAEGAWVNFPNYNHRFRAVYGVQQQQTYPPGPNVEREYRATVYGQTEPETFVLGFDQVINTLVCEVNFRIVLLAEEAPRLAKINAARAAQIPPLPPVVQLEYTTHDHVERGYGIRYEVECRVGSATGPQAIPGQDYNGVDIAFTFHAENIQQFDIAQERTLHQPSGPTGPWVPETDFPTFPLDQYDRLLSEIAPVHLAKSSCDCVGSASTTDISWFIAVHTALADPDGDGPALPGEVELKVLSPAVRIIGGEKTLWNIFRTDGTFKAGLPLPIVVRLRNTITGAFITDPNVQPPSESGLVATVKRVVDGDVDDNVALEGFLIWGDTGAFLIDPLRRGYYSYVWQTVQQDTRLPLPPGRYSVTIASKYTAAEPFFVTLR